jgi:ring-1,2-phenylacetyl-CoA epoxidase subunit PaaE
MSNNKKNSNGPANNGDHVVTIILDEERTEITVSENETILEAALDAGLDAPFSCQGGVCTSCLAKVVSGTAMMEKNTVLSDDEVKEGLILTCQAHPTSTTLTIDYDDV